MDKPAFTETTQIGIVVYDLDATIRNMSTAAESALGRFISLSGKTSKNGMNMANQLNPRHELLPRW